MLSSRRSALAAFLALITGLAPTVRANAPQDLLPPALPWHGASESLVARADDRWITPAEKTGLLDSPDYDATLDYLKRLCAASPYFSLEPFGRTAEGRTLYLVVATKEKLHTPAALLAGGRPTLLAQAGIHAGEIDGKDAGLMLLRDLAFADSDGAAAPSPRDAATPADAPAPAAPRRATLLDRANFLFVPVFNADGHERSSEWTRPNQRGPVHMGWRTTAQNLNLNRDYAKADSPEMRAMLALLTTWQPDLYVDLHVTDGIDYQYDITFGYNGDYGQFAFSPHIAAWLDKSFRPAVTAALSAAGHIPGPLVFAVDDRNLAAGLAAFTTPPRFSHGYGDLRHLATVLVENHSLKPYPQRVLGTYVFLEAALRTLATAGPELRTATVADRTARPAVLPVNWGNAKGDKRTIDFLGVACETFTSAATGAQEVRWLGQPKTYHLPLLLDNPTARLTRPKAYWVPVTKPDVIERLALHGIRFETLGTPETHELEFARLLDPKPAATPFEGHTPLAVAAVKSELRTVTFPKGSICVPTDQPLGDLALTLLEPLSADSFLASGFFPEILQRTEYIEGYVLAPLADRMLAADPALKAEFDKKLAADPAFAADPSARLAWFYARTKFYDDRYLLYPVGIER